MKETRFRNFKGSLYKWSKSSSYRKTDNPMK